MIGLAALAFLAAVIAALLKFIGGHADAVQWLFVISLLLVSAAVAWGWAGPRWGGRAGPHA